MIDLRPVVEGIAIEYDPQRADPEIREEPAEGL